MRTPHLSPPPGSLDPVPGLCLACLAVLFLLLVARVEAGGEGACRTGFPYLARTATLTVPGR